MLINEDEDIKIAPSSFARLRPSADSGEEAARLFLEQKECGNIDKARALGKSYADAILHIETGPVMKFGKNHTQRERHHLIILYSYIVNRVIAEKSPNSIVAQTSLNVFYSEIEANSDELHKHVSDMAAFSLYILCERTPGRSDAEIGSIYAELCDFEGNSDIIEEGNAFYRYINEFCTDKINGAGFVNN